MKKYKLFFLILCLGTTVFAQEKNRALIIIDIQEFYFDSSKMPLEGNLEATQKAAEVLSYFRESGQLIIHVRHKGGGDIHPLVKPLPDEKLIEKNQVNAFRDTDLDSFLKENGITELVLLGMQTQMCLEAATRAADDLGYNCTVISDACASRDLEFEGHLIKAADVHYSTLNTLKSYAKIVPSVEFLKEKIAD